MRRVIALTIVAVLGISGVASAAVLVTYSREGGFRGVPLSLTVSEKGRARAFAGVGSDVVKSKLGEKPLKRLKRLLKAADFPNLKSSYLPKPGTIADGFTETIAYNGYRVATGTGAENVPPALEKVAARLAEIASEADTP